MALPCYEKLPEQCHRSHVADAVARGLGRGRCRGVHFTLFNLIEKIHVPDEALGQALPFELHVYWMVSADGRNKNYELRLVRVAEDASEDPPQWQDSCRLGLRGAVDPRISRHRRSDVGFLSSPRAFGPGGAPAGASLSHMALHGPSGAEKGIEKRCSTRQHSREEWSRS